MAEARISGLSCELIDLRTILPWDIETVTNVSNKKAPFFLMTKCKYLRYTRRVIKDIFFLLYYIFIFIFFQKKISIMDTLG